MTGDIKVFLGSARQSSYISNSYPYYDNYNFFTGIKNIFIIPRINFLSGKGILSLLYNEPFGSARPFWTLFIEWWFYVLCGGFYLGTKKSKRIDVVRIISALLLLVLAVIYDNNSRCCLFCFLCGVLINRFYRKIQFPKIICGFILFLFLALFMAISFHKKVTYCIEECIIVSLIICTLIWIFNQVYYKSPRYSLKVLAGITYPMYLIHYSIMDMIRSLLTVYNNVLLFFASIGISLLVSIGLYYITNYSLRKGNILFNLFINS